MTAHCSQQLGIISGFEVTTCSLWDDTWQWLNNTVIQVPRHFHPRRGFSEDSHASATPAVLAKTLQ